MSTIHDRFGTKYGLVESNSWSETYFEQVILNFANDIFPNYFCFPFKHDMYYLDSKVRADLILIEKSYREWWLVEVELERHSWLSHIQSQILRILNAEITRVHIEKLRIYSDQLNMARLENLMLLEKHKTLVIVDAEPKSWMDEIQTTEARLMTIQVYRSEANEHIIRCDTTLPQVGSPIVTYLSPARESMVPSWLEVESPHRLDLIANKVLVQCEEEFYECSIREFGTKIYLIPPSRFKFVPVNPNNRLVLLEDSLVSPDPYFRYSLRGKVVEND